MARRPSYDVLIAGGGVMGCSVAYHLAAAAPRLEIAVVERDPTYARASTPLSVGNIRVQFSLAENVLCSVYALEVFDRFEEEMAVDGERPAIRFRPEGNLFLVSDGEGERARRAIDLQRRLGGEVELWETGEIAKRFPQLRLDGYAGGTFGARDGQLDGHALLAAYRRKAASLGVDFLTDDALAIRVEGRRCRGLDLRQRGALDAGVVVNCTGAWARALLQTAGIDLPVAAVSRQAFFVATPEPAASPWPLVVSGSGLYFRSEAPDLLLVGQSFDDDPRDFRFAWQESRFSERLWPELVRLVPRFDRLRLVRGWAGLYALNELDGNAILGAWPELAGLYLANGFSGHGLQQAPAVGRYLAELVLDRQPSLDLSALGPERILARRPLGERGLV